MVENAAVVNRATTPRGRNMLRTLNLGLVGIAIVVYCFAFGREGLQAVLFFFPFTMTPLIFQGCMAASWKSLGSQITLLLATIGYVAWFTYLYVDVTIIHLDPQSPIAFLFVGIYALPVLAVLWLIAYSFEWGHRSSLIEATSGS
jgi:peptidoglycan/LPS O-acetylase OafA/YrhL